MFYTLVYYLGLSSSVSLSFCGVLYYYNRPAFDNLTREVGWLSLNAIAVLHKTYDYFVDVSAENLGIELQEEDEEKRIVSYSLSTGETTTSGTIPPSFDMLFIKKKIGAQTYCKRIHAGVNLETLVFTGAPKPFIQVELKYDNQSIEIHDYLDYFYIVENHILDTLFLKWYMKYWYHINLTDDYTLHIIDADVNIIELSPSQSVLIESDGYKIVTCAEESDDSEEEKAEDKAIVHVGDENAKDK